MNKDANAYNLFFIISCLDMFDLSLLAIVLTHLGFVLEIILSWFNLFVVILDLIGPRCAKLRSYDFFPVELL